MGPWTPWWTRNLFADLLPWLRPVMSSSITRLAVGALGLVTAVAGLTEIWRLLIRRSSARTSA